MTIKLFGSTPKVKMTAPQRGQAPSQTKGAQNIEPAHCILPLQRLTGQTWLCPASGPTPKHHEMHPYGVLNLDTGRVPGVIHFLFWLYTAFIVMLCLALLGFWSGFDKVGFLNFASGLMCWSLGLALLCFWLALVWFLSLPPRHEKYYAWFGLLWFGWLLVLVLVLLLLVWVQPLWFQFWSGFEKVGFRNFASGLMCWSLGLALICLR